MPSQHRVGPCALMAVVCLSVCPVPDSKSRTEVRNKLKIGRQEAHDTDDPFRGRKIKGQGNKVTRKKQFQFRSEATTGGAT